MEYDPSSLVPLRWPAAWDAATLDLVRGTRINCLIFERADAAAKVRSTGERDGQHIVVMDEAPRDGIVVAALSDMKWNSDATVLAATDARWPGVRVRKRGERSANAGPTGAAWVDANGWIAQLAKAKAPTKTFWLASKPGENEYSLRPKTYLLAIAEAGAYGVRWPITLDEGFSLALRSRDAAAIAHWRRMMDTLNFFEERRSSGALRPAGTLGAVSDFTGANEFVASEFLNLAARRNLMYRVLDKTREPNLDGLRAIIYLDQEPVTDEWRSALMSFASDGGLVLAQSAAGLKVETAVPCDLPGYRMWSAGKGHIAMPVKDWEDPWVTASETQMLVGRRYDPVRLFNPGGLNLFVQSDGKREIVHLLNYTLNRPGDEKTIAPLGHYSSARITTLGAEPISLAFTRRQKVNDELPLPPFEVYAAIELEM
jgi:hypothetical protein